MFSGFSNSRRHKSFRYRPLYYRPEADEAAVQETESRKRIRFKTTSQVRCQKPRYFECAGQQRKTVSMRPLFYLLVLSAGLLWLYEESYINGYVLLGLLFVMLYVFIFNRPVWP